ncbi:MAG TPA: Mur ligase family protein [Candidatus Paceibacterota bacterium]|nr:Mur ligase family protein [Candidatus Paceibacterota bacterium]HPT17823.1 Mur ligase family protein [Candidatus Paceibacterota bacterium]
MKDIFKKIIIYILQVESKLVLLKYKPKVVSITGSVGKTSTKDAVYAVISGVSYVRKSEKSFNSEIGLPLTILGCPNGWNNPVTWLKNIFKGLKLLILHNNYPEWLVLEVGIGKPGDMKRTASWLRSDAVIITTIGETPVHIEFFNSRKHLIEEKAGLIKTLRKDGILVLNADDEAVIDMKNKTKNKVITYGFKQEADICGSEENIFYGENGYPKGIVYRIDEEGKSLPVTIEGVFGKNHIYASLGALALSSGLKFNMLDAINRLKTYEVPPGRMRLLSGINDSLIIDDTYNSSPFACESGLRTVGEVKNMKRKIAVLGDMLELGKHTKTAHENIGKIASENVDIVVVVGQRADGIKNGAIDAGMNKDNIFEFLNSTDAGEFLKTFVRKNDLIFIKGSQGMRMERTVEAILFDKENKSKLLVRQDAEWVAKK